MAHHSTHEHDGKTLGEHHAQPFKMYVIIFFALMGLMLLTVAVAKVPWLHIGPPDVQIWNNIVAVGIAVTKTFLVVGYFMHVKWGTPLVKTYAILGFAWVTLLWLIFGDYLTRGWESVEGWERIPATSLPRIPYEGGDPANPIGPGFGSYGSPAQEEFMRRNLPNVQHPLLLPEGSDAEKPVPKMPIETAPVPLRPEDPVPQQLPPIQLN